MSVRHFDNIVVGGGVSGLTMTLLLAMSGRRVLLLEKGPRLGGSLARFRKDGVWFETGFHFTGGLHRHGVLDEILTLLGIRDAFAPVFLTDPAENRFYFEAEGRCFEHPVGLAAIRQRFKADFPAEAGAIDAYFDKVRSVCDRTPSLSLRDNTIAPPTLDEDYVSLDAVLKELTADPLLRGLLSGYAMCYGARPDEVSFANHARMACAFYESLAFVRNGGDAFIDAFREKFRGYDIEVRCGTTIAELADLRDHRAGRFLLSDGSEVTTDACILTIHPAEILRLLPEKARSRAFAARVDGFEPAAGFFALFAAIRPGCADPYPQAAITSLFPQADVNRLLDPAHDGEAALVIIKPPVPAGERAGICILEPNFVGQVAPWADSALGRRPEEYRQYKAERVAAISEHIFGTLPAYRDTLEILDAGSMLTFRDYLHNPDGSAYGIRQKLQQFNVIGRLPVHNLFAAGQSALLPGIIGAMMSSLIVGRAVLGKDEYGRFLEGAWR
ncbi:MAG: NAD(P)/FAD-dependent oxidoreductase [Deltaproteobacteria bacterium]|nr:MAG: NAD(P)/FAD-dependent oxidoreductase [Deltaproteobacteria bacterium]